LSKFPLNREKRIWGKGNRFELADKFTKDRKQAKIIASKENPEGIRDFLKKIGSNFQIQKPKHFFFATRSVANRCK
jgi:hypothetical protein